VILLFECAALLALTIADMQGWVPLSRTPFLVLLAWASLRLRRMRWRDIGLRRPERWGSAIALGVAAGVAIEAFADLVTTPMIAAVTGRPPDLTDFQPLIGNLPLLLILVAVNWVLAAFGEELAFRGYLMNRAADVTGDSRAGWAVSLIAVSVFFGIGHATQGVTGIIQESLSGAWLGVLFLACGRNLTIPIIAHGVSNTLALVLMYFGTYPGLTG
jgi:membrane protease YdiL (CAAX protease family)